MSVPKQTDMYSKSKFLIVSFILIFLLGIIANLAMAQGSGTVDDTDNSGPRVGIKGGINFSNLYVDDVDDENARIGFNVGLYTQLFSNDVFAIQPELLYSTKGTKTTYDNGVFNGEVKYNLNYLEIPVLAVFKLGDDFEIHAGPYFGYLLNANIDYDGDFDDEDELDRDDFNKWDVGLSGGIGFNFGATQIGARYNYGLKSVLEDDSDNDEKNSCAQLYIAFNFN